MRKILLTLAMMLGCTLGTQAQKVVTLNDTQDLTSKINGLAGVEGKYVKFTDRVVNGDMWNVLVLPFDTNVPAVSKAFGYAAVDMLNEENTSGNIHFMTVTGNIPANTPFLLKPTSDPSIGKSNFKNVMFSNVTLVEVTEKVEVSDAAGNKCVGTYAPTTFFGVKYWYMTKGVWKDASLYTEENPVQLKALRAYVDYTENTVTSAPKIIIDEPDGTTTTVDAATFNTGSFSSRSQDDSWYSLTGVRLTEVPTQKGVYIHQGRKVIIR